MVKCSDGTNMKEAGLACVICNGCPENRFDSARVQNHLRENGWRIVDNWEIADLIIFEACALTRDKINISLRIIDEVKRKKKQGSRLIVWGCLSKIDPEALKSKYVGPTFAEAELSTLDQIVGDSPPIRDVTAEAPIATLPLNDKIGKGLIRYEGSILNRFIMSLALKWQGFLDSKFNLIKNSNDSTFYIKISTGCKSNCAYCGVRLSRGLIKSMPMENVVREFQRGLQKGFKKFSLLGTDVSAYGHDKGYNLADLLKKLVALEGDFKIGLRNINPFNLKNMLNELLPVFKSKKIWYLECPAESGNNRILKLMNRNYTIEEYKHCVETIRSAYDNIVIRTQIIVGFPTETEQEFEDSMKLIDDLKFDYVEIYKYSDLPGTASAKLEPKVSEKEKKCRVKKILKKGLLNRIPMKIGKLIRQV